MAMSWFWAGCLSISIFCSILLDRGALLAASIVQGAQSGITLAISIAGSLCLWSGIGGLMSASGVTGAFSKLLYPLLTRLFPSAKSNPTLAQDLSGNICANILGLGNAATPMGVRAAQAMKQGSTATDELCRLVVLNTASIQLIPANVAAVRSAQGCLTPFDILPAVWITSILSAGLGLACAWMLGRIWDA